MFWAGIKETFGGAATLHSECRMRASVRLRISVLRSDAARHDDS